VPPGIHIADEQLQHEVLRELFLVPKTAVANLGSIDAPNGTAELATGNRLLLQDSSTGQQVFVQAGNGGQTRSAGMVRSAPLR
jgi:hypothetical protein